MNNQGAGDLANGGIIGVLDTALTNGSATNQPVMIKAVGMALYLQIIQRKYFIFLFQIISIDQIAAYNVFELPLLIFSGFKRLLFLSSKLEIT